jgi:hypothetical protein
MAQPYGKKFHDYGQNNQYLLADSGGGMLVLLVVWWRLFSLAGVGLAWSSFVDYKP